MPKTAKLTKEMLRKAIRPAEGWPSIIENFGFKPTRDQPIPGKSFKQLSEQITTIMKPYTFVDVGLVLNGEEPLTRVTLLESIKMNMWNLMNTIFTGRITMTPPAPTPAPAEPPKPAKVAKPKAPKWLTLAIAEVGTKEGPGSINNPTVLSYWESAKLAWIKDDATPWCAGFANAMLERAGIKGSRAAYARSFLNWGTKLDGPVLGAVTVLNRPPNPTQGHVGFLVAHDAKTVTLVGGNQGDSVCYAKFPNTRVIGYRWPANPPITTPNPVPLEETVSGAANSTSEA